MIVLTNRAYRTWLPGSKAKTGHHISKLSLRWQDGTDDNLSKLLARPDEVPDFERSYSSNSPTSVVLSLGVEIDQKDSHFTAQLLVSEFDQGNDTYRILSFEGIRGHMGVNMGDEPVESSGKYLSTEDSEGSEDKSPVYTGTTVSTNTTQAQIKERLSALCEAVYYVDDERSGFLLAADNTFCFPNYRGMQKVVPVEIDNIELFFLSNFNLWDEHFLVRTGIADYPAVYLNRERRKWRGKRYGLIQDGQKTVINTDGDPLFDPRTGEYIGGVT